MGRPNIMQTIREIFKRYKKGLTHPDVMRILDEEYGLTPKQVTCSLIFLLRNGYLIRKKSGGKNGNMYEYRLR